MQDEILSLWKFAPVVALLVIVLWAGHKGWWFWSAGVRAIIQQLEHERDEWRRLALTLLRKEGVDLPADLMAEPTSILSVLKNEKEKK